MRLTLKTLSNKVINLDVETGEYVADLKAKIENYCGNEFPSDQLKLILNGKVLENDQKINDICYTEKSFIVLMKTRVKSNALIEESKLKENFNQLNLSEKSNSSLIVDMGYSEAQALYALNECENDLETAMELLIRYPEGGNMAGMMADYRQALHGNPQLLDSMVQEMRDDPNMTELLESSFDVIAPNSDEDMHNDHGDNDDTSLTLGDMRNIEHISSMGFNEDQCIEAYLVFGKNVEAAINFLLSNFE